MKNNNYTFNKNQNLCKSCFDSINNSNSFIFLDKNIPIDYFEGVFNSFLQNPIQSFDDLNFEDREYFDFNNSSYLGRIVEEISNEISLFGLSEFFILDYYQNDELIYVTKNVDTVKIQSEKLKQLYKHYNTIASNNERVHFKLNLDISTYLNFFDPKPSPVVYLMADKNIDPENDQDALFFNFGNVIANFKKLFEIIDNSNHKQFVEKLINILNNNETADGSINFCDFVIKNNILCNSLLDLSAEGYELTDAENYEEFSGWCENKDVKATILFFLNYIYSILPKENNKIKEYIYFPIQTPVIRSFSNGSTYGAYKQRIGGILLGFYNHSTLQQRNAIWNFVNGIFFQFHQSYIYLNLLKEKIELNKHAIRAAISQVLARNLSHNIGSHVMSHVIDSNQILFHELEAKLSDNKSYQSCFDNSKTNVLKANNQLAVFNNYIKCRMDYLSEITFGVPSMQSIKKIYAEVFRDFDKIKILLNNISGINEFKYKLCFKYKNSICTEQEDISIAFPSDVLGVQAFYNILENIIRNTVKHDQCKDLKEITNFTVTFYDINKDSLPFELVEESNLFYIVEITDDIPKVGSIDPNKITSNEKLGFKKYNKLNPKKEVYWFNVKKIDWLIDNQNIKLNQSVLQNNNQLRTNSLGLLEMEASAAFLRKIDLPEIESVDYEILPDEKIYNTQSNKFNILKAFKTENNALGYRIFLLKPQELLIVGDWQIITDDNENSKIKKTGLLSHGIWFKTKEKFFEEIEKGYIYNHLFVLYDNSVIDNDSILKKVLSMDSFDNKNEDEMNKILALRTQLPFRCLNVNSIKANLIEKLISPDFDFKEFELMIWEKWVEKLAPEVDKDNIIFNDTWDFDKDITKYPIVLLNHSEEFQNSINRENGINTLKNGIKYLEPLSSYTQFKLPDNNNMLVKQYLTEKMGFNDLKKYKIFESFYNKIIVIDERVQKHATGINKDIFKFTNVCIPDEYSIKLDAPNFDDKLVNAIEKFIVENIDNSKFLLIHYGILERMYQSNKSIIGTKLVEWAKINRVVATSGRGKHSLKLPEGICYVNLSAVTNVFIENRSKYSINYLLNQARK